MSRTFANQKEIPKTMYFQITLMSVSLVLDHVANYARRQTTSPNMERPAG
jgi:hypothetical protein